MTKLSWAVVCVLVVFNSAAIVASFTADVRGAGCNPWSCTDDTTVYYECFHESKYDENGPINGGPCAGNACISNTEMFSRCNGGEGKCNFRFSLLSPKAIQSVKRTTLPCVSAPTVTWTEHSNSNPCSGIGTYYTACKTSSVSCSGTEIGWHVVPGGRYVCQ
jgi:hypothetical protein